MGGRQHHAALYDHGTDFRVGAPALPHALARLLDRHLHEVAFMHAGRFRLKKRVVHDQAHRVEVSRGLIIYACVCCTIARQATLPSADGVWTQGWRA
jgi:hypothetical protein